MLMKQHVARMCRALVCAMAVTALAGCATQEIASSHIPTQWQQGQGVVALKVITPLRRTVDGLTVKNLATGEVRTLVPTIKLGGQGVRLMASLDAGQYQLVAMNARAVIDAGNVQVARNLSVPLDAPANRFEVKSAQLTDLGSLAIVPKSAAVTDLMATQSWAVMRDDEPIGARDWLGQVSPALVEALPASRDLGWSVPVPDAATQRKQLLPLLRAQALVASDPVADASGRYWAGADLGVVMRWDASSGRPDRFTVDSFQPFNCVAPLSDGRVLAAGDEGYVVVLDPASGASKPVPAPVNKASTALWMGQAPDGLVYLANRTPDGVVVLSASPKTLQWQVIRRMGRGFDANGAVAARTQDWVNFASLGQSRPMAAATRSHLVVYTAEPHAMHVLDFQSHTWEVLPGGLNAVALERGGDDALVARDAVPNSHVSFDHGRHWQKIDSFMSQLTPVFVDEKVGFVVARPAVTWTAQPPALYKTVDGGLSWQPAGEVPTPSDWDAVLLWDSAHRRLGYLSSAGRLWWRAGDGQPWR